ncbi:uncharacterized protein At4g19900-like [Cimex lectularius]|uniref:Alpha-1,4-N-acetylglucosaminyltransferase n=1 Tax=Cimex lectularius TaxID=79782 RepID=A0A8I6ST60_CIMLE|nr:uncharacterized protein At4g19900-like [Cimex lectularius]
MSKTMNRLLWMILLCVLFFSISFYITNREYVEHKYSDGSPDQYNSPSDFEGFDNETGTKNGCYIVPNYVHFIRFDQATFSFVDLVCVLAALKNQRPEKIFFHTNVPAFRGKYWEYLLGQKRFKDVLQLQFMEVPKHVFGQRFADGWVKFHAGDIARLKVLMKYGGIFLDNDSFIVKSLNEFRKFEMTLGWAKNGNLSNQVILANKNARFLREWLNSYKGAYNKKSWFYNAGIRPTQEILMKRPELIHREKKYLAEFYGIVENLYLLRNEKWKNHYAIHLLIRHQYMLKRNISAKATYPVVFDENNIKNYPISFRDMVASVYPL